MVRTVGVLCEYRLPLGVGVLVDGAVLGRCMYVVIRVLSQWGLYRVFLADLRLKNALPFGKFGLVYLE